MSQTPADRLLEDLRTVMHDAEEVLRATAGQAGEHIAAARTRAQATLDSAQAMLTALGDTAGARVRGAARQADTYVRSNPWIAVAAGTAQGRRFFD